MAPTVTDDASGQRIITWEMTTRRWPGIGMGEMGGFSSNDPARQASGACSSSHATGVASNPTPTLLPEHARTWSNLTRSIRTVKERNQG
jgi:hypothetical protein